MAWVAEKGERPRLETVIKVHVPYLVAKWVKPDQARYCARTTLGALRKAAATAS
jgi:hypothetical protein